MGVLPGQGKNNKSIYFNAISLCKGLGSMSFFFDSEGQEGYFVKRMFAHSILAVANRFIVCHSNVLVELFHI